MARLFHRARRDKSTVTVGEMIAQVARRLGRARVFFGHGTDNAHDEAVTLVFHVMRLAHDAAPRVLARRASAAQRAKVAALLEARVTRRVPLAYLTHEAWFAGLKFYV